MLLDFYISNWKSFAGDADLSLIATRERQHSEYLAHIDGFRSKKALPVAAIYGGNASGKTNLFSALGFLRWMVISGPQLDEGIPVEQFKLSAQTGKTNIEITVLAEGKVYYYQVELDSSVIYKETLSILHDQDEPTIVFDRDVNDNDTNLELGDAASNEDRWKLVGENTRSNQLFLNAAANSQIETLLPLFRWFRDSLVLVGVDTREADSFGLYISRTDERQEFLDYVSEKLRSLDTGIEKIAGEEASINDIPPRSRKQALKLLSAPGAQRIAIVVKEQPRDYGFEMYTISGPGDNPAVRRLRSYHRSADGKLVAFNLNDESSGSKRLLGLLPMLFDLQSTTGAHGSRVYVVDELDRCFHTMLTQRLIQLFLDTCDSDTHKQMIFTTHDLLLMDQEILRRDEMYLTERDSEGKSELVGLNEFKGLRSDKDLIRSYLDGRFGGIPMLR